MVVNNPLSLNKALFLGGVPLDSHDICCTFPNLPGLAPPKLWVKKLSDGWLEKPSSLFYAILKYSWAVLSDEQMSNG